MKVKSESEVAQSCQTLSDPMDCSPPGSSVHEIFQARVLEWGAIALLGGTALSFLLEINGITKYRGRWQDYNNIPVMPTFHPAFLLRKAEAKREAWHDLKLVMAKLGISV